MNINKSCLLIFIFTLFILINNKTYCIAQNSTSSPYSMFGLGDIEYRNSVTSTGMGGVGIALPSTSTINVLNPASHAGIDSMQFIFDLGLMGKFSTLKTKTNENKINDINISSILFGFRAGKHWAMSFGLLPYSTIGYRFDSERVIEGTTTYYSSEIEGSGGINQFLIGNSFKWKNLSIGVNVSYLFGNLTINETNSLTINESDYDTYSKWSYYLKNFYFDYGLQYRLKLGSAIYSIGLTYSHEQTLNSKYITETYLSNGDVAESEEEDSKDIVIPQEGGIGIAFQIPNRLTIAADYSIQDWTENTFVESGAKYQVSQCLKLGIEYKPKYSYRDSYFKYMDYRIGAYYRDLYYVIHDIPISEMGVSIGFGLPLRYFNKINVSLEYAIKGTTKSELIEENYFKVKVGLTLRQMWFQRFRFN